MRPGPAVCGTRRSRRPPRVCIGSASTATRKPLDNPKFKEKSGDPTKVDVPVTWCREIGKGRLFYTNFGHREETFAKPKMLQHMLDGIQFAAGDLEAPTTPSAEAGLGAPVLAPEAPEKE